jgi:hypothetical protein
MTSAEDEGEDSRFSAGGVFLEHPARNAAPHNTATVIVIRYLISLSPITLILPGRLARGTAIIHTALFFLRFTY